MNKARETIVAELTDDVIRGGLNLRDIEMTESQMQEWIAQEPANYLADALDSKWTDPKLAKLVATLTSAQTMEQAADLRDYLRAALIDFASSEAKFHVKERVDQISCFGSAA